MQTENEEERSEESNPYSQFLYAGDHSKNIFCVISSRNIISNTEYRIVFLLACRLEILLSYLKGPSVYSYQAYYYNSLGLNGAYEL